MMTIAADMQGDWGCEGQNVVQRVLGLGIGIKGERYWTEDISLGKSVFAKDYISAFLSSLQVYERLIFYYHTLCVASTHGR